ncbi:MAG TPA: 30S ribosomal protein S8 [Candidatus Saccharimonadales bacterium]|nr:30S ribosomal protein S8 [Candidatus Saccharimonadales bacterium]
MNTDPIADMLTRIRNAARASRGNVFVPYSKIKEAIAKILSDHDFIAGYRVETSGGFKSLAIDLTKRDNVPAITTVTRISKPGRRVYAGSGKIPRALGGQGIVIISTSQGLMTDKQARRSKLGGELICKVW